MAIVKVYNLSKTSDDDQPAGFSSWIEYWESLAGIKSNNCAALDCNSKAEHGCHVQPVASHGEFIVPLCPACNKRHDVFSIKNTATPLVPVPND